MKYTEIYVAFIIVYTSNQLQQGSEAMEKFV